MAERHGLKWYTKSRGTPNTGFAIDVSTDNNIVVWQGPPYIPNIGMIDVYLNGVLLQLGTYIEISGNSIEYIGQIPINSDDVFSIRYRGSGRVLNNIRIVNTYNELLNIQNPFVDEIVLCKSNHIFYKYSTDGVWEKYIGLFESTISDEEQTHFEVDVSVNNSNTIEWEGPSYVMSCGMLEVFLNGIKITRNSYTELTPHSIEYTGDIELNNGDIITIRYCYSKVSFGNVAVIEDYDELESYNDIAIGALAIVKNKYAIYQWDGTKWNKFLTFGGSGASGSVSFQSIKLNHISTGEFINIPKTTLGTSAGIVKVLVENPERTVDYIDSGNIGVEFSVIGDTQQIGVINGVPLYGTDINLSLYNKVII